MFFRWARALRVSLRPRLPSWRRLATHAVTRNLGSLYVVQIANYAIPLAVLPYLARVLHPEHFGLLAFAQSFGLWATFIIEYGFVLSGARAIARQRADNRNLPAIVASVLGSKALLSVALAAAGGIALAFVPLFRQHAIYLAGACFLALAQGWSPIWFFQGIERMAGAAAVDVAGRVLGAGAIFLWVRNPRQAYEVLFFYGGGAAFAALVNYWRLFRQVQPRLPKLGAAIEMLRSGFGLFFYSAFASFFASAGVFVLGLFVPAAQVADFAGAEKIARAFLQQFTPLSRALFPRMSFLVANHRARAMRVLRWSLAATVAASCLLAGAVILTAPLLVRLLLGPGYAAAVPLLRWLALLLPMVGVTRIVGGQWLLPFGQDRAFNFVVGGAGLLGLGTAWLLVPHMGDMGMVLAALFADLIAAMGVCIWALRLRLPQPEPVGTHPAV